MWLIIQPECISRHTTKDEQTVYYMCITLYKTNTPVEVSESKTKPNQLASPVLYDTIAKCPQRISPKRRKEAELTAFWREAPALGEKMS